MIAIGNIVLQFQEEGVWGAMRGSSRTSGTVGKSLPVVSPERAGKGVSRFGAG